MVTRPPTTFAPEQSRAAAAATRSEAAKLRARLSSLLQAHAYLSGLTTAAGAEGSDPAPLRSVLDQTDADLGAVVASVFDPSAGQRFLTVWRRQSDLLLSYAQAKRTGDSNGAAAARTALVGFRSDLAAVLSALSPSLTTTTVTDLFSTPVTAMLSVADAQVARGNQQYESLRTAAATTPPVAELLARAFVKHAPDNFAGNPNSPASTLLTTTADLLQEHVYLSAVTTGAQVSGADVQLARNTLDASSQALANVLVSAYGSATGDTFLSIWRGHIASYLDYGRSRLSGNQLGASQAGARLDQFAQDLGGFLAGANPNLSKDRVAASLIDHVTAAEAIIDAQVAHSPQWVAMAREEGRRMLGLGASIASALAAQLPDRFPGP